MKSIRLIMLMVIAGSFLGLKAQTIDSENSNQGTFDAPEAIRAPIDRPYERKLLKDNVPVTLQPLDEEYMHHSSLYWRVIDLREKMNHPLYFPTEPKGNWKSFALTIRDAVDSSENNPMPVRIYSTEYLDIPLSQVEFQSKFSIDPIVQSIWLEDEYGDLVFDEETGDPVSLGDTTIMQFADPRDIMQYDIKELWYIDNQRSVADFRIMGLCPVLQKGGIEDDFGDDDTDFYSDESEEGYEGEEGYDDYEYEDDDDMQDFSTSKLAPLGWLHYLEFRPVMAVNEVFNPHNNSNRRTYDDIFLSRHFSSFIRAEENVYDNREIFHYIVNGLDQILEAEKIKQKMFAIEHDMWEY